MDNRILSALQHAKRASLFGYGKSNQAVHRFLTEHFPHLLITLRCDGEANLNDRASAFCAVLDKDDARKNLNEDLFFLSPTVRRDSAEFLAAARGGARLSSDIELFFELYQDDALGITGSDGKSTTTYLAASMISTESKRALPLGNFGKSPLDELKQSIFPVIELSSFQLMNFSPKLKRACITNVSRNHLNWHKGFDEYLSSKLNIIKSADEVVYDYDSPPLRESLKSTRAYAVCSSAMSHRELTNQCNTLHTLTMRGDCILLDGAEYLSLEKAKRKESYNLKNYLLAVASSLEISDAKRQKQQIESFCGLPHRCELIHEYHGIKFYDSSIDTSQKRTLSTLNSLQGEPTLILTGRPKSDEISELVTYILNHSIKVVLFGECTELYAHALDGARVFTADSMESAVEKAFSVTASGGCVLLSPSCTSFDIYSSFEERGEDFRRCVLKYK